MQITFIGGGLAGLTSALALAQKGIDVRVIEKNTYPFHKVCGEYISNEVLPYLTDLGANPEVLNPAQINELVVSDTNGKMLHSPLDLGGFGVSRFALDSFLVRQCKQAGVEIWEGVAVNDVAFNKDKFTLTLSDGKRIESELVAGTYGKRSKLDRILDRDFFHKPSPYVGVKYHVRIEHPEHLMALHNFEGGYCGISHIENGICCLCYLAPRDELRRLGSIAKLEEKLLGENPHLKYIFENAKHLFDKPIVINEISFATKEPVKAHILMAGDTAGMIAPLCGNGMAMAIHAGKILSEEVVKYFKEHHNRQTLESNYARRWNALFKKRLSRGRIIQKIFGHRQASIIAVAMGKSFPFAVKGIIAQTHGEPFGIKD